jgi:hypothetical protein
MESLKLNQIVLWTARITGGLLLAFLIFMVGAHVIDPESANEEMISFKDGITFFFFPACTIIGLTVAFKKEGLGGLISTIGFVGMNIIRPDLLMTSITFLAIPGLLYILYWYLTK